MEMSSHALEQERVWGIPVDVAMFTNLTQDHLDYHGTMEAYASAKAKLFSGVGAGAPRVAVINADDAHGNFMRGFAQKSRTAAVWTYGYRPNREFGLPDSYAENVVLHAGVTKFTWVNPAGRAIEIESPLTGRVNVYNLLAAATAALARGLSLEEIASAAKGLRQVPGRFEVVPGSREAGFTVVVDYAHTDDALRNLMALARDSDILVVASRAEAANRGLISREMAVMPTMPPQAPMARMMSSVLLRGIGLALARLAWVMDTGSTEQSMASRVVRGPTWDRSTRMPRRLHSATTSRPNAVSPSSTVSPHPLPTRLVRW